VVYSGVGGGQWCWQWQRTATASSKLRGGEGKEEKGREMAWLAYFVLLCG